jgi:pimeloyl-ACP methyl ester carboxylesterase
LLFRTASGCTTSNRAKAPSCFFVTDGRNLGIRGDIKSRSSRLSVTGWVAPDQRGYGLTDAPTAVEAYDILHLAGDLVGLVNALGEERAVIIGHDWGSVVAAATALLRPDLFRALGLLSVPYLLRRPIRPSARFHMATHERHFYQDYFQQPDHVEKELEADVRRTLLGVFYTASGDALTKLSSSSFCRLRQEDKAGRQSCAAGRSTGLA